MPLRFLFKNPDNKRKPGVPVGSFRSSSPPGGFEKTRPVRKQWHDTQVEPPTSVLFPAGSRDAQGPIYPDLAAALEESQRPEYLPSGNLGMRSSQRVYRLPPKLDKDSKQATQLVREKPRQSSSCESLSPIPPPLPPRRRHVSSRRPPVDWSFKRDTSTISQLSSQSESSRLDQDEATQLRREAEANSQEAQEIARLATNLAQDRQKLVAGLRGENARLQSEKAGLEENHEKLRKEKVKEKAMLLRAIDRLQVENARVHGEEVRLQEEHTKLQEEKTTVDDDKLKLKQETALLRRQMDDLRQRHAAALRAMQRSTEATAHERETYFHEILAAGEERNKAELSRQNARDTEQNEKIRHLERRLAMALEITVAASPVRAKIFYELLGRANHEPDSKAIAISVRLHKQLAAFGLLVDESAASTDKEDFQFEDVFMGNVDREDFKVPICTKLLRRAQIAVDCSICLESFHEIEIGSLERWMQACNGYEGSWMSDVFSFPAKDALRCDHKIDFCKQCLQRHLECQLEQHGRNAEGRLSCPSCSRVLSEPEVRTFGSGETVRTYDHYRFLAHLSKEPNFRYCLNSTCNSGQIYEQSEYPNPHITCDECEFEMCFTHQIPWHTGSSCTQYDSQREHGDPDYEQTQHWVRSNSKKCPGCNVDIEKGNACFHMTCTQCRHEFCWECLGNWVQINPQPGTYVKAAHNIGCWFRDSDLEPTQVSGRDLEEALGGRRR